MPHFIYTTCGTQYAEGEQPSAAGDNKARRLLQEGASCVLPDFSDPVRVAECLEAIARMPCDGGGHERTDPT